MAPLSPAHRQGCARLGMMRLKAARLNVYESWTRSRINGVGLETGAGQGLRIEGAGITHQLNDQVDTAQFRARGVVPVAGQTIQVYDGDVANQLFGGRIIETTLVYEQRRELAAYDLRCIDPTWLLQRQVVLGTYINQSATAIVLDLVARFTRNVTTKHVVANLAVIDAITFTNEQVPSCLTEICKRIGAYWFIDYAGDLHVQLTESTTAGAITDANPRTSRNHSLREDLSQVITKVIGRGGGVGVAIDMPAGQVELPVEEGDEPQSWYAAGGGLVEVNAQRVNYSGVRGVGGAGALVGTGNAPSAAVKPGPLAGSSHTVGATYKYAASFVTAAGETLPGPPAPFTIQTLPMVAPPAVSARSRGAGSSPPGMIGPGGTGQMHFAVQVSYRGGARGPLGAASPVYGWDGNDWEVYLGPRTNYTHSDGTSAFYYPTLEPGGPAAPTNNVTIYRYDYGFGWSYASSDSFTTGGGWYYQCASGYFNQPYNPMPSSGFGSVTVAEVPVSKATGVTSRKLYRTVANGSVLKLLATLANNTATSYDDSVADAALGAVPPLLDTSGIRDEGQVLLGSTSLPVSATAPFTEDAAPGTAGWARVGGMVIRYTGIGTGVLTGIPATGAGAITATLRYGVQALVQSRLVGIPASGAGALLQAVRKGDTVTIRLELTDGPARDAMAERLKLPGQAAVPADGLIEYVVSDSRFGLVELLAQMTATLQERKDPLRTLSFESRDPSLEVGRLITINISLPPISGTFRIQRAVFSEIAVTGDRMMVHPLRKIDATNKLYTFSDLLRRIRGRESGVP